DPLLCTACGLCVEMCPEVFEMVVEAAEVISDPVPLDQMDCVIEAEESCPVEAITHS
ncbi:MAG: ferredoxin, partial [Bacteroidales bacterium]|nr:ferredoxin [Bacteroidales bacterium]